jgi:hypothetical protein
MPRYVRDPDHEEARTSPRAVAIDPEPFAPPARDEQPDDYLPIMRSVPASPTPTASLPITGDPAVPSPIPGGRVTVPVADDLHWFG